MTGKAAHRFPSIFLTHAFEFSIAGLHILTALTLMASGLKLELTERAGLGPLTLGPIALAFLLGGIGMILGPQWRGTGFVGRSLERAGLYLVASGWVAAVVAVSAVDVHALPSVAAQAVVICSGCIGRAIALSRVDKVVTHVAEIADNDGKED